MKSMRSSRIRVSQPPPQWECGTSGGGTCRVALRASSRHWPPDFLFACPFRFAFFEEGNDTLAGVCGRGQFFEVNLLRPRQSLVKVDRVPCVKCLLGMGERDRT